MKRLALLALLVASCGGAPPHPPSPPPTTLAPTPTPNSHTMSPMTTASGRFVVDGLPINLLGPGLCCNNAKAWGWPWASETAVALMAASNVNYVHVRLGPYPLALGYGVAFAPYETLPNSQVYDVTRFRASFWTAWRVFLTSLEAHHIRAEVSGLGGDAWGLKHANDPREPGDGWPGVGCSVMSKAPGPVQEAWVRKVIDETADFPNVMFEIANESFLCNPKPTIAYEVGIAKIARDEAKKKGIPWRILIGSQSQDQNIIKQPDIDYSTWHRPASESQAHLGAPPFGKPGLVNELNSNTLALFKVEARNGKKAHTGFELWRSDMSDADFKLALKEVGKILAEP